MNRLISFCSQHAAELRLPRLARLDEAEQPVCVGAVPEPLVQVVRGVESRAHESRRAGQQVVDAAQTAQGVEHLALRPGQQHHRIGGQRPGQSAQARSEGARVAQTDRGPPGHPRDDQGGRRGKRTQEAADAKVKDIFYGRKRAAQSRSRYQKNERQSSPRDP